MPRGKLSHTGLARPYRSHKVPACDRCRQRKIRCLADEGNLPCRPCTESETRCSRGSDLPSRSSRRPYSRALTRGGRTSPVPADVHKNHVPSQSTVVTASNEAESALIVGPAVAEDLDRLEQYLTSHDPTTVSRSKSYRYVVGGKEPVYYFKIPRGRQGVPPTINTGRSQREVLEQIFGPFRDEVIGLFFRHVHPCFPVLDKTAFMDLWSRDRTKLSSTLLCDIYAAALLFWDKSAVLTSHPQPDMTFAWNQAVLALDSDFAAPTLSTIHAALIDMNGRPVLGITGNVLNVGRVVNLAQTMGLHRDPSTWNIPLAEKKMRIRLWWGVYIHDIWSSLAHGIPPSTCPSFADVPLPTPDHMQSDNADTPCGGASSFVKLCSLSRVVAKALPVLYSVEQLPVPLDKVVIQVERALQEFIDSSIESSFPLASEPINGSSSLKICYLLAHLLIERLAVKVRRRARRENRTNQIMDSSGEDVVIDRASTLIQFVSNLQPSQLQEFWFPYVAHLLPSSVTIFLRCIAEAKPSARRIIHAEQAEHFIARLQNFSHDYRWDIGDLCLERCVDAVKGVSQLVNRQSDAGDPSDLDLDPFIRSDVSAVPEILLGLSEDGLALPWEATWFNFEH